MGYRSTDVVLQRVQVATGEIYVSSFTCCFFESHKFPRHSFFLSFLFLSICPSIRDSKDSSSCIIAIAPREKLNLKLIDCRNELVRELSRSSRTRLSLKIIIIIINAIQKRLAWDKRDESTENGRVRLSLD